MLPYSTPLPRGVWAAPLFFLEREVIQTRPRTQARPPCRVPSFVPSYSAGAELNTLLLPPGLAQRPGKGQEMSCRDLWAVEAGET